MHNVVRLPAKRNAGSGASYGDTECEGGTAVGRFVGVQRGVMQHLSRPIVLCSCAHLILICAKDMERITNQIFEPWLVFQSPGIATPVALIL